MIGYEHSNYVYKQTICAQILAQNYIQQQMWLGLQFGIKIRSSLHF